MLIAVALDKVRSRIAVLPRLIWSSERLQRIYWANQQEQIAAIREQLEVLENGGSVIDV